MIAAPIVEFSEGVYYKDNFKFQVCKLRDKNAAPSQSDEGIGFFHWGYIIAAKNNKESRYTQDFCGKPVEYITQKEFQNRDNKTPYIFPESIKTNNFLIKFSDNVAYYNPENIFFDMSFKTELKLGLFNLENLISVFDESGKKVN